MKNKKFDENYLQCTKCNETLQAPSEDREINQCKCKNRAWIQKRPAEFGKNLWAYGSVCPLSHIRIRSNSDDETR